MNAFRRKTPPHAGRDPTPGAALLVLALACREAPQRYAGLRDPRRPLPPCFNHLVSALSAALAPGQAAATAAGLGTAQERLRTALMALIRQVLLHPQADYYRTLGLPRTADPESIAAHYHALVGLFHPDRSADGRAADTARLNQAYRCLKDPIARLNYDRDLLKTGWVRHRWSTGLGVRTRGGEPGARPRAWLVGSTLLLMAAALAFALGGPRQTLRMAATSSLQRQDTRVTQQEALGAPQRPLLDAHALPEGTTEPRPATSEQPWVADAPPATATRITKVVAARLPPVAPVKRPEDLIERFRRYFAAGDLPAILLLLADDAQITNRGDPRARDPSADFFAVTLNRTLRLTATRLDPGSDDRRFAANLGLQRADGARPAGEIHLELERDGSGYRIAALVYRIDPATKRTGALILERAVSDHPDLSTDVTDVHR